MTDREYYQLNKAIEAMIDERGDNPEAYSPKEKQYIQQYSGYGGLQSLEEISLDDATKSIQEFYTPDAIIKKMWALCYKYGFKNGNSVLEPSCGIGKFLKYVPAESPATAHEINKYSYTICKVIYPQFTFNNTFFETNFIKNRTSVRGRTSDLPKYDLVITNPPYGRFGGLYAGMGEASYVKTNNYIDYFIFRGMDLLNKDGLLCYFIGGEIAAGAVPWLKQQNNKIKEQVAEKADLIDCYRFPAGVMPRTDVVNELIIFKKK